MKITKWFLLAMLALLCCACSKNNPLAYVDEDADEVIYFNPLAYVDEDADWVVYGNSSPILKHRFWDSIMDEMEDMDDFKSFKKELKDNFDVDLDDCRGKFAVWSDLSDSEEGKIKCVIVFDEIMADDVIDAMVKAHKKDSDEYCKCTVDEEEINDHDAYVLKKKYKFHYGDDDDEKEWIDLTVIKLDEKIIQIVSNDKPHKAAKPSRDSKLAKQIDKDCVIGAAISGNALRKLAKADQVDLPKIGDVIATCDISDID